MSQTRWGRCAALVLVTILAVACGKQSTIDTAKLEGTWRIERVEGVGSAPSAFRIGGGRFTPLMASGRFTCSTPYRVSGNELTISANTDMNCRFAELVVEVELSGDQLILKKDGGRAIYRRAAE